MATSVHADTETEDAAYACVCGERKDDKKNMKTNINHFPILVGKGKSLLDGVWKKLSFNYWNSYPLDSCALYWFLVRHPNTAATLSRIINFHLVFLSS